MINGEEKTALSTGINTDKVAEIWNTVREDKVTPRAVKEQIRFLRNEINGGIGVSSSTPSTGKWLIQSRATVREKSLDIISSLTRPGGRIAKVSKTPNTPARPTKRSHALPRTPASVKRTRVAHSSEDSAIDLTEEAEESLSSSEEEPAIPKAKSISPRKMPARNKTKLKTYVDAGDSSPDEQVESASDFELSRKVAEDKEWVRTGRSPTVVGDVVKQEVKVEDEDNFFDAPMEVYI